MPKTTNLVGSGPQTPKNSRDYCGSAAAHGGKPPAYCSVFRKSLGGSASGSMSRGVASKKRDEGSPESQRLSAMCGAEGATAQCSPVPTAPAHCSPLMLTDSASPAL